MNVDAEAVSVVTDSTALLLTKSKGALKKRASVSTDVDNIDVAPSPRTENLVRVPTASGVAILYASARNQIKKCNPAE